METPQPIETQPTVPVAPEITETVVSSESLLTNGEILVNPEGKEEKIIFDSDDGSSWHKEVV